MLKENQPYNIQPADRLANVSEYYFSRKLKEVAQMNAEGKNVISLGIGSPDMPPSAETIEVLCENARKADAHGYQPTVGIPELRQAMATGTAAGMVWNLTRRLKSSRSSVRKKGFCTSPSHWLIPVIRCWFPIRDTPHILH